MNNEFLRRGTQKAQQQRASAGDRISTGLTTVTSVDGVFMVNGSGEATQTVNFPVKFVDRPNFVFGGELHLDSSPTAGQFPTVSCVINTWNIQEIAGFSHRYFVGCNLLIVTTGPTAQRMWIHWRATGRALTNPTV